ncbi:MAG: YfbM family protein [Candidatus Eremiobacterota bacterium]
MSMIGNLARLPDELAQHLLRHPGEVHEFLYGSPPPLPRFRGLFAALLGRREAPTKPAVPHLSEEDSFCLEKDWHILHFLFTGTAWDGAMPECFLVKGGREVGNVDVGYGPARCLSPVEVETVARFLDGVTIDRLRDRYDVRAMAAAKIYGLAHPPIASQEELSALMDTVRRIRDFLAETARRRQALLVYIN